MDLISPAVVSEVKRPPFSLTIWIDNMSERDQRGRKRGKQQHLRELSDEVRGVSLKELGLIQGSESGGGKVRNSSAPWRQLCLQRRKPPVACDSVSVNTQGQAEEHGNEYERSQRSEP